MKVRLAILVCVAIGLAVYFAVRSPAAKSTQLDLDDGGVQTFLAVDGLSEDEIKEMYTPLGHRPLEGKEPSIQPAFDIQFSVDTTGRKNRIEYTITEVNGFYCEEFDLEFFHRDTPESTYEESGLFVPQHVQKYVPAGGTLENWIEIVPAELDDVGGHMGTEENWDVEIIRHGRCRTTNPQRLPRLPKVAKERDLDGK